MKRFLVIDVGGTFIKVYSLIGDNDHFSVKKENIPTKDAGNIDNFTELIKKIAGITPDITIAGIPGEYDYEKDLLITSPNIPQWKDLKLKELLLKNGAGKKIIIENDVNLQALGEFENGYGKKWNNFVFIAIGTGIGSGIIIDGKLVKGKGGGAGEIGHMLIQPDGERCGCGRRGCLEAYASGSGIVKNYKRMGGEEIVKTSEDVYALALNGNRIALKAFEIMGKYLGWGIANIVNMLEPEGVILSGGVTRARKFFEKDMKKAFKERAFTFSGRKTPLEFSRLTNHSLWGALNILKKEGKIPSSITLNFSL